MQADTALNVGWALLCIGAVLWHLWRRRRDTLAHTRLVRVYRALSVFLAAVALFPCISASDDRVRLQDFDAGFSHSAGLDRNHAKNLALAAQLDAIEDGQATAPFVLDPDFTFLRSSFARGPASQTTLYRAPLSRGPPVS